MPLTYAQFTAKHYDRKLSFRENGKRLSALWKKYKAKMKGKGFDVVGVDKASESKQRQDRIQDLASDNEVYKFARNKSVIRDAEIDEEGVDPPVPDEAPAPPKPIPPSRVIEPSEEKKIPENPRRGRPPKTVKGPNESKLPPDASKGARRRAREADAKLARAQASAASAADPPRRSERQSKPPGRLDYIRDKATGAIQQITKWLPGTGGNKLKSLLRKAGFKNIDDFIVWFKKHMPKSQNASGKKKCRCQHK